MPARSLRPLLAVPAIVALLVAPAGCARKGTPTATGATPSATTPKTNNVATDFADYLQLRYHPCDWFYFQYRTGLRTFDNRRGVILDKTRLTSADASTTQS